MGCNCIKYQGSASKKSKVAQLDALDAVFPTGDGMVLLKWAPTNGRHAAIYQSLRGVVTGLRYTFTTDRPSQLVDVWDMPRIARMPEFNLTAPKAPKGVNYA